MLANYKFSCNCFCVVNGEEQFQGPRYISYEYKNPTSWHIGNVYLYTFSVTVNGYYQSQTSGKRFYNLSSGAPPLHCKGWMVIFA